MKKSAFHPKRFFPSPKRLSPDWVSHGLRVQCTHAGGVISDARLSFRNPLSPGSLVTLCQNRLPGTGRPDFGYVCGYTLSRATFDLGNVQNIRSLQPVCPMCEEKI